MITSKLYQEPGVYPVAKEFVEEPKNLSEGMIQDWDHDKNENCIQKKCKYANSDAFKLDVDVCGQYNIDIC